MAYHRRALVLAGGGLTGIAWHTGLLTGLWDAGVDLTVVDCVVGTSAGALVGTQLLAGRPLAALYRAHTGATGKDPHETPLGTRLRRGLRQLATAPLYARLPSIRRRWSEVERMTPAEAAIFGEIALRSWTMNQELWLWQIERRLGVDAWPARDLLICAVDALSGQRTVWDREAGVRIEQAVAASAAQPTLAPPVNMLGRRYIDGGFASQTSADLARGCDYVVILIPQPLGGTGLPRLFARQLDAERAALCASGSQVAVIAADHESLQAMGASHHDPTHQARAARAAYHQGMAEAERLRTFLAAPEAFPSATAH
jgi:NTE family protein